LNARCLELLEHVTLHSEILRVPPAGPELSGTEQYDWRPDSGDRQRGTEPNARRRGQQSCADPPQDDSRCRAETGRASPPSQKTDEEHGQDDTGYAVDDPHRAVANRNIARQKMRDSRCHDLHAGHHRFERGREEIAAPRNGGTDHDNFVRYGFGA
jgi:hypothetical protein